MELKGVDFGGGASTFCARVASAGGEFDLAFDWRTGTFQGEKFAIFCFNPQPGEGFVDVGSFIFTDKKE